MTKRVAILISGRGSNMAALIDAAAAGDIPAEIAFVLSNRPDAGGLDIAARAGIETMTLNHKGFASRAAFDGALAETIGIRGIDIICLAGFLRIFTDGFVESWHGRMLNIHPALLPSFKGTLVHEQALAAGVTITGCTVHFVVPALDSGPIIGQAAVPVHTSDTPESLEARVLKAEHKLYPLCLKLLAEDKVRLDGERAVFKGAEPPALWFGD
jgi:phosphoribosylglycinamide formyltransferase-1